MNIILLFSAAIASYVHTFFKEPLSWYVYAYGIKYIHIILSLVPYLVVSFIYGKLKQLFRILKVSENKEATLFMNGLLFTKKALKINFIMWFCFAFFGLF
jgi:hypothetical protein